MAYRFQIGAYWLATSCVYGASLLRTPPSRRIFTKLTSNDPDFESKAADVIGLYLNPPQHAAVFCVEEKTAIQALDRKDPVLRLYG